MSITILVSRWVNTIFTAVWLGTTSVAVAASRSELRDRRELLVGTNGEARRSSFRQVGIVSREIRFFTRIVVPEQVVRNEDRTVETQRRIFTVVGTGFEIVSPMRSPVSN